MEATALVKVEKQTHLSHSVTDALIHRSFEYLKRSGVVDHITKNLT